MDLRLPQLEPSQLVGDVAGSALFLLGVGVLAWPLVQRIARARRQRMALQPPPEN